MVQIILGPIIILTVVPGGPNIIEVRGHGPNLQAMEGSSESLFSIPKKTCFVFRIVLFELACAMFSIFDLLAWIEPLWTLKCYDNKYEWYVKDLMRSWRHPLVYSAFGHDGIWKYTQICRKKDSGSEAHQVSVIRQIHLVTSFGGWRKNGFGFLSSSLTQQLKKLQKIQNYTKTMKTQWKCK